MFWYLTLCILLLYPFLIVYAGVRWHRSAQTVALQLSCFLLWFFMAMRASSVGVDTKYYCYVFEQLSYAPLSKVFHMVTYGSRTGNWTMDFEPGYRLYNRLAGFLSHDPQMITIMNSSIIILLLYKLILKQSKNAMLSIWLYITLGVFQTEMNVARNAIAILLVYLAFQYVKKGRLWPYMITICLAATIHKSVLVFLPLYFVFRKTSPSRTRMKRLILHASLAGMGVLLFGSRLQALLPGIFGRYLTAQNIKMESLLVGGLYLFLVIFILFYMKNEERQKVFKECPIGIWMFTITMCCFGLNIGLKMAARLAALFGTYMIILIPNMVSKITDEKRRHTLILLLIIGCGVQYILRMTINNIGGTMPYSFFW